jgi:outer membrane immunogenic protein
MEIEMNRRVLAAALLPFFATSSFAADMAVKAPPPPAPATPSWTGFYVGGNVGYGWSGATGNGITSIFDPGGVGFVGYNAVGGLQFPSVSPSGAIGGVQAGYNLQIAHWVWGLVTDFQFSNMTANGSFNIPAIGIFVPEVHTSSARIDWLETVRGRVGYAWNNWQPYLSGGLAYGKVSGSMTEFVPSSGFFLSGTNNTTKVGWTIGGGVDYALSRYWTAGVDYLYFDVGSDTVTEVAQNFAPASISMNQRFTGQLLRAVLDYRF